MNNQWLIIKQLDVQLKDWQAVNNKYGRPRVGWVKVIKTALGMSTEQLAKRLGVKRGRVTQLEHAEVQDAVTLRTLREVADAMECEFVYAIVPKRSSTLESIIKTRAEQVAQEKVAAVAHTMSLEAQSVNADQLQNLAQIALADGIASGRQQERLRPNKKLWESTSDLVQTALAKGMASSRQQKKQKSNGTLAQALVKQLTQKNKTTK